MAKEGDRNELVTIIPLNVRALLVPRVTKPLLRYPGGPRACISVSDKCYTVKSPPCPECGRHNAGCAGRGICGQVIFDLGIQEKSNA